MAFDNPCQLDENIVNTGTECNEAMGPTALILLGDTNIEYTPEQVEGSMLDVLETAIHAAGKARVYPLFGNNAPIRDIQNTNGDNVLEEMPDGSTAFVRSGKFTRLFLTKEGGDCLGKILYQMNGSTLGFIEVDANNKVKMRKLANGNYSFIPVNMIDAPLPSLASFTEVYKNAFRMNFDPKYYVKEAVTFVSSEDLTGLSGLVNAEIVEGTQAAATTYVFVKVQSVCANTDLVAEFPTEIVEIDNFVVKDGTTVITPSAVAIVGGEVKITFTAQTSGDVITVTGANAATLKANGIEGFDIVSGVSITLP
jgi:Fe-S cluster assembly iron-binding protein IscA